MATTTKAKRCIFISRTPKCPGYRSILNKSRRYRLFSALLRSQFGPIRIPFSWLSEMHWHWTPLTTVPKKFHYFSNLKNVFKTWFRRPINDLIELCFLWFYMCFCKINHLNRYFETLYGIFSSWWPNRVINWYYEPKKPKISVFWGIVCFVATFLQVLICKITRKTTWKNHKKGSTG